MSENSRRYLGCILAMLTVSGPLAAQDMTGRPLEERRVIAALESEKIPAVEAAIEASVGTKIPVTVEIASFPPGLTSFELLESRGFKAIPEGFAAVASDDLGKTALTEKITAVKFLYDKKAESMEDVAVIKDKVLVISYGWDGLNFFDGGMLAERLGKIL